MRTGYVYIMASESGTLYIGVTSNLSRRIFEHKQGTIEGFSKKYECRKLVYFEQGDDIVGAIEREKQLKKWSRSKKEKLIASMNPQWKDLSETIS
ncbi:GIY-YIG nuclease family protein [Patescibacteria group bacterium]|nr:GIY-YIG nuclease family protein [Patescibacteria group bacterium]MBP9710457.1 GIY-YIG nuclease family protein [Patescibacteria group bacterium]